MLLQEELKHLYTGITRAKSNVVFFDLNREKRAPFYNLLRSFGMARVVNRWADLACIQWSIRCCS